MASRTFDKIVRMGKTHRMNGFTIIERDEKFYISMPKGPFNEIYEYEISKENVEKAMQSDDDAYEVMVFAETGKWPVKDSDEERTREFLRQFPELLVKIPDNQKYFDPEELQELLAKIER